MKATLDLPEEEVRAAMQLTGAATESEAVTAALVEFVRRRGRKQSEVIEYLGTCKELITPEELATLRATD